MAPKRPREDEPDTPQPKKPRTAFKVGPDNLPDGTWKRKVVQIKKNLIHKAKVKKSYARLKAREPPIDRLVWDEALEDGQPATPSQALHPERQAMLDAPRESTPPLLKASRARSERKRSTKPAYFEKETAFAEQKRAEAEARKIEFEGRERDRKQKIAERERYRKTMAKARTGGRNGQRKLGRESKVLLEKVKRAIGS